MKNLKESQHVLPARMVSLEAPKEEDGNAIEDGKEEQMTPMYEFHESSWAGQMGSLTTFEKPKDKYWWPGIYNDVAHFVGTCESCHVHLNI